MTAIAVKDSRVARGNIAQPEDKPERQNQPEANTLCSGHFDTIAILTTVAVSISRAIAFTRSYSGKPLSIYIACIA